MGAQRVQGITWHLWPSPECKGSCGKHWQHFQTHSTLCPTVPAPKCGDLRAARDAWSPPSQEGVPHGPGVPALGW